MFGIKHGKFEDGNWQFGKVGRLKVLSNRPLLLTLTGQEEIGITHYSA